MNVIKNEKGTFVELPRESIVFCGNTEEEKKANELIFDLSLENDGLQQELERYKNIIDETIEYLYDCKKTIEADKDYEIEDYLVSASTLLEILKGE